MVGNIREEFVFTFFVSKEQFTKIKTAKLLSTWKVNEPRFNVSTDKRIRHQHKDTNTWTRVEAVIATNIYFPHHTGTWVRG